MEPPMNADEKSKMDRIYRIFRIGPKHFLKPRMNADATVKSRTADERRLTQIAVAFGFHRRVSAFIGGSKRL
jgi:hypothetical protein